MTRRNHSGRVQAAILAVAACTIILLPQSAQGAATGEDPSSAALVTSGTFAEQENVPRPARAAIAPAVGWVISRVGPPIAKKYGPKILKLLRRGSRATRRARARGRSAARRLSQWGNKYGARRGMSRARLRSLALRASASFQNMPRWVQGCGLSVMQAEAHGARLTGMVLACLKGILTALGHDPVTEPGAFPGRHAAVAYVASRGHAVAAGPSERLAWSR